MIDTNLLTNLATSASFTKDSILINVPHMSGRFLLENFENYFALWARAMNKKATIIKTNSGEIRVPASLAVVVNTENQDESSVLPF